MDKFLFNGFALYHDKIIFEEFTSGLLCELDTNTGIIRYIEDLNNYQIEKACFDCMLEFEGKLYAIGNNGNIMMIYNGMEKRCEWKQMNCGTRPWGNFMKVFGFGGMLFFFHTEENWVTCYDTESGIIENVETGERNANICCCRIENEVWMFPRNGNIVQVFDLETKLCTDYKLDYDLESVISCIVAKEKIYLLQDSGLIYIVNIHDMMIRENPIAMADNATENRMGKFVYAGNNLVLFPLTAKDIKQVDLEKECVTVYTDYPNDFKYDDNDWSKYYVICEDNRYYYLLRKSNYLLKIDKKDGRFIWLKLQIENDTAREKLEFKYAKHLVVEGKMGVKVLIENADIENTQNFNRCVLIGGEIWRRCL